MHGSSSGWLGDSIWRDYSRKLDLWNSFAAAEIRDCLVFVIPAEAKSVLDAGCGTGQAAGWMRQLLPGLTRVVAFDLARPHVFRAKERCQEVLQADVCHLPFRPETFNAVWSGNTLHHVPDPIEVLREIQGSLAPVGVLAIGESSYLPDMLFAWDSRLERVVNEAVRAYYRERYGRSEAELAGIRAWVGRMRQAGFVDVAVRTVGIERISPLDQATRDYVQECLFDGTFKNRLSTYLGPEDHEELESLMDPQSPRWALMRPDFHFLQTFTVTWGRKATG